jgi:hypothetical protein
MQEPSHLNILNSRNKNEIDIIEEKRLLSKYLFSIMVQYIYNF